MPYTAEQMERRQNSKWTMVQVVLAPLQLLTFFISLGLIIRYLSTGDGYAIANFSVLLKIALLWIITITGMFWEKEVFDAWFMGKEFFWEDAVNLLALGMHNLYFLALLAGWSHESLMTLMLVAYISYLINFAQFGYRGMQAHKQRSAESKAQASTQSVSA